MQPFHMLTFYILHLLSSRLRAVLPSDIVGKALQLDKLQTLDKLQALDTTHQGPPTDSALKVATGLLAVMPSQLVKEERSTALHDAPF